MFLSKTELHRYMRKIIIAFAFFCSLATFAQSAKDIIDQNLERSGGLTNWKLLNSILLQGKVSLGINDIYPIKIFQQRPDLTKTVITIGKKETAIEGYDGTKGYAMNYATNKLQIYDAYMPESFDNDFIDYESKGFEAKMMGKEKLGENYCYKIELTKNVNKATYYFDVKTLMLLKEIKKDETIVYSDYRKVGTFLMPFRLESSSQKKDGDYVMLINKIETNREFPSNTFKLK